MRRAQQWQNVRESCVSAFSVVVVIPSLVISKILNSFSNVVQIATLTGYMQTAAAVQRTFYFIFFVILSELMMNLKLKNTRATHECVSVCVCGTVVNIEKRRQMADNNSEPIINKCTNELNDEKKRDRERQRTITQTSDERMAKKREKFKCT